MSFFASRPVYPRSQTIHVNETRKIIEQRAPTDESVRILSEMEQAAETRLVERIRLVSQDFSAEMWVFIEPTDPFRERVRVRFRLGSKTHDFTVILDEKPGEQKYAKFERLRDEVAKHIATEILKNNFQEMVQSHFFKR